MIPAVTPMQRLPLYFDLRQIVVGNGFVASVRLRGRATGMEDFGSIWIYGVNPGALADHGPDLETACANFRHSLGLVLFGLAELAADFGAFRRALSKYLEATDRESVDEWIEARREIRGGRMPEVDFPPESDDLEPQLQVLDLTTAGPSALTPDLNEVPAPQERLAA